MVTDDLQQAIARGMAELSLPEAGAAARLARYVALLARWNRVYNLTAVREPRAMVARHVLDSLAIAPWLQGPTVLDVGSGAGLPGIPLAVTHPALHFHLLDSSGKRTRFMTQMLAELELTNVDVVRARVEDYRPAAPFATVTARAFAPLPRLLALTGRFCADGGRLLAMQSESAAGAMTLPAGWRLVGSHRLRVPGLAGERRLLYLAPAPTTVEA